MKDVTATDVAVRPAYVEWGAVFAGAVLAAAVSFVLLTAGAAIGLSMVSAEQNRSYGAAAAWLSAFWAIAVPIGSLLAGGYVAGRMRNAFRDADADEVSFRDGIHGVLVWSVSVLLGAALVVSAASTAGRIGASAVAAAGETVQIAAPAIDSMIRQSDVTKPTLSEEQRGRIGRVIVSAVRNGALSEQDRAALKQTVAQVAGIPPQEADRRVSEAYDATVKAVETARRATVAAGLVSATALLMGLAAAFYAAQRGGAHRDSNRPARFLYRRP